MKLFDFSRKEAFEHWRAIDDRVMGGVSESELVSNELQDNAGAIFRGELSLNNNGGFCSVRATLPQAIKPGFEHLWIRCKNSAHSGQKTYYLNMRTDVAFDGISYRTSFLPTQTSTRFEFTTIEFSPVFRGRAVADAPALQLSDVRQIGLMIADSQIGTFELFISSIGVS